MKNVRYLLILLFSLNVCPAEIFVTREESKDEIKYIYSDYSIEAIFYKKRKAYLATERVQTKRGFGIKILKNPKSVFETLENQYLDQVGTPEAKEFREPGKFE